MPAPGTGFIFGAGPPALPQLKADDHPAVTPLVNTYTAADFNGIRGMLSDIRDGIKIADFLGLQDNNVAPVAPANNLQFRKNGGNLEMSYNAGGYASFLGLTAGNKFGVYGNDPTAAISIPVGSSINMDGIVVGTIGGGIRLANTVFAFRVNAYGDIFTMQYNGSQFLFNAINGATPFALNSSLTPQVDNTQNLGAQTLRWGRLYLGDGIRDDQNVLRFSPGGNDKNIYRDNKLVPTAASIAHQFDTTFAYPAGGKLVQIMNNAVEKRSWDSNGKEVLPVGGAAAVAGISGALSGAPGAVTVATTAVTASSIIILTRATAGGTIGNLRAAPADIVAGTSFVIRSDANETSTVFWEIKN